MYIVELLDIKSNKRFEKVFYDKFLATRFITKCNKGNKLKVLGLKSYESWCD